MSLPTTLILKDQLDQEVAHAFINVGWVLTGENLLPKLQETFWKLVTLKHNNDYFSSTYEWRKKVNYMQVYGIRIPFSLFVESIIGRLSDKDFIAFLDDKLKDSKG